jgi:hypothetical protein
VTFYLLEKTNAFIKLCKRNKVLIAVISSISGEVSYRIGEKGAVKVLFSSDERAADERTDREVNFDLTTW